MSRLSNGWCAMLRIFNFGSIDPAAALCGAPLAEKAKLSPVSIRGSEHSDAKRFLILHIGSPVSISSRNQRRFSPVAVFSPKRRFSCRRALASTSGAEMSHGQNSPTTSPAWRRCMAELSRCHVKLTESRSRTVSSYRIAGTAARWLNQTYSSNPAWW